MAAHKQQLVPFRANLITVLALSGFALAARWGAQLASETVTGGGSCRW